MNDRKNVVVGLFVLGGAILLGAMIVKFKAAGIFFRGGYTVKGYLPSARGIREGKRVHVDGIDIGCVRDVTPSPHRLGVWVDMQINTGVEIPNEAVFVAQQGTAGDLYLDFRTTAKPTGYLPTDGTAEVEGRIKTPELLPEKLVTNLTELAEPRTLKDVREKGMAPNLSTAMEQLQITAENVAAFTKPPEGWNIEHRNLWTLAAELQAAAANLNEFAEPRTLEDLKKDKNLKKNLWTVLEQVDVVIAHTRDQLESPESDLRQFMKNARQSAEKFNKTLDKADKTVERADKAFTSLKDAGGAVKEAAADIRKDLKAFLAGEGKARGTIPKLIKDDELHRALVTLIENLNSTLDNVNRLAIMLRKEGLGAKEP